jgi:uncharacterized repeat protein (TIGR03803 family)
MGDLNWREKACAVFVLGAAAVAAQAQTFNSLASFNGSNGQYPARVSLSQGRDGQIYGTTAFGGADSARGTVFKITMGGTLTTIHSFCEQGPPCADGYNPFAGVIQASDGNLYGTTLSGGANDNGTVFRITQSGALTTLYSFCAQTACADGAGPQGVIQATDGDFYGTTAQGGTGNGGGTVFKITAEGELTTLHSFDGVEGVGSYSSLVQGTDGNFYGTTYEGGANGLGTVFKVTRGGSLTSLHSFDSSDGGLPIGALVQGIDGSFYGTTSYVGGAYAGTVFKITAGGVLTTLHDFNGDGLEGSEPLGGVIQATDGNFYGVTESGGTNGEGTVYKMTPNGTLTTIHNFCNQTNCTDGNAPFGGLLQATNGNFYGTTYNGGVSEDGTGFSLSVGLGPFVTFVRRAGKIGQTGPILGQGFTGSTSVSLNGIPANFTVVSDTFIRATVPAGATTGYVTVTTPSGTLTSNVPFHVIK